MNFLSLNTVNCQNTVNFVKNMDNILVNNEKIANQNCSENFLFSSIALDNAAMLDFSY